MNFFRKSVLVFIGLASIAACSLKRSDPNQGGNVQLHYQPPSETSSSLFSSQQFLTSVTPPSTISGFDCLVFNVVGSGIAPQSNFVLNSPGGLDGLVQGLLLGQHCTYPGVMSQPFSPTASATRSLNVPAGARRIVQVLGVKDSSGQFCSSGSFSNNDNAKPFELGRAIVDIFQETSVSITSNYNSLSATQQEARKVACETGGGSTSFNPATIPDLKLWFKASDWFQSDNVTSVTPTAGAQIPSGYVLANRAPITSPGFGNLSYTSYATKEATWHNTGGTGSFYVDFPEQPGASQGSAIQRTFSNTDFNDVFGASSFNDFSMIAVMAIPTLAASTYHGFLGMIFGPDLTSSSEAFYFATSGLATNVFSIAGKYNSTALSGLDQSGTLKASTAKLIHHLSYQGGGTPTMFYKLSGNNGSAFVEEQTSTSITAPSYSFVTDTNFTIGSLNNTGTAFYSAKGQVYEVLFFTHKLTAIEENQVRDYLRNRHGI